MKTPSLTLLFALISIFSFSQRVYYVQDKAYNANASDMNPGTEINLPWATWQRAFNTAKAGDTVYFRGGVWYPTTGLICSSPSSGIGTYGNRIHYFNYPGEVPILDGTNITGTQPQSLMLFQYMNYIHIKGLVFQNMKQKADGQWIAGVSFNNSGTLEIEQLTSRGHGGTGIWLNAYDTLSLVNCDSYNNIDSTTTSSLKGGRADGFNISSGGGENDTLKIIYINGCRAFYNSDDGFDLGTTKQFIISNSWSFHNGRLDGDGNAFKLSYSNVRIPEKRQIYNSIMAYNICHPTATAAAFNIANLTQANHGPVGYFYNNIGYNNDVGYCSSPGNWNYKSGTGEDVLKNNVFYNNRRPYLDQLWPFAEFFNFPYYLKVSNNTFIMKQDSPYWTYNPATTVTDDDFIEDLDSINVYNQMSAQRSTAGMLPEISVFKLAEGSNLIDAGLDVGLSFNGLAPDLGAFESGTVPGTGNKYPKVLLKAPTDKHTITNNEITLQAEAYDLDGSVTKVDFYMNDTIKIGESTSQPWNYKWINAPLGHYTLRAVATDNDGARATSSRISVLIIPGNIKDNKNGVLFPNPNNGYFTLFLSSPMGSNSSLSIMSIEGRIIYTGTVSSEELVVNLELPYLKPGIYVLMISSTKIMFAQKFIKM